MLFFAPLLLLATLSSALPAPVASPMDTSAQVLDERSGSWKAPIFEAMGMNRARIVANATLEARARQPRLKNPKWTGNVVAPAASASVAPAASSVAPVPAPVVPTTTTTTVAPQPTVVPFTGQATFFFREFSCSLVIPSLTSFSHAENGNPGACGVWNSDSLPLVALDYRLYGDMGKTSSDCGRKLTITNTANGKSVVAIAQVSSLFAWLGY